MDRLFITNLKNSIDAVMFVAKCAALKGHRIVIPGMRFAPGHEDWHNYVDEGYDLIIKDKTYNVKESSRVFSSIDQFFNPMLVSAVHVPTPDYVFILSADHCGGILIPKETKEHWNVKSVYDKRYGTSQDCYTVDSKYVIWQDLRES